MKEVINEMIEVAPGKVFQVPTLEYASTDEANKHAGNGDRALEIMNTHLHYHGTFHRGRRLIADCAKEVTGIAPAKLKKKRGNKEVEVEETAETFVNRVFATKPDMFDKIQALVTARARGYKDKDGKDVPPIATNAKEREAGAPRIAKLADKWKAYATEFINEVTVERKKGDKVVKIKRNLGDLLKKAKAELGETYTPVEGAPKDDPRNVEALGWICKRLVEAQDPMAS